MSANQIFDIAAALIIVVLGVIGFLRGFISAVMSFVGLFCGTFFAWKYSGEGTALFQNFFPNVETSIANIAAMAIIFFCVAIVVSLISRLLGFFISFARLSAVNHMAGMLVGLATGLVLVIIIYGVVTRFAPEVVHGWVKLSIFMNIAEALWPQLCEFLSSCGIDIAKLIPKT